METNQDGSEVQETTEKVAEETTQETPIETEVSLTAEEIEELKRKADASSQNFERLKKTEAELKEAKAKLASTQSQQTDGLSNKDILFLAKADIHEDDLDEVLDRAKFKKISVAEAYKQVKPLLDTYAEERKSAATAHTKGGARATSKTTGEDLLQKAERTGEVPDTDAGMRQLAEARLARRKK